MSKLHLVPYPNKVILTGGFALPDITITENEKEMPKREAYFLRISEKEIYIEGDKAGIFYAYQTLHQLQIQFGKELPCLEIEDAPRFSYRGLCWTPADIFCPKRMLKKSLM